MHRKLGLPFLSQKSRFLVLTKSSAASGDENATRAALFPCFFSRHAPTNLTLERDHLTVGHWGTGPVFKTFLAFHKITLFIIFIPFFFSFYCILNWIGHFFLIIVNMKLMLKTNNFVKSLSRKFMFMWKDWRTNISSKKCLTTSPNTSKFVWFFEMWSNTVFRVLFIIRHIWTSSFHLIPSHHITLYSFLSGETTSTQQLFAQSHVHPACRVAHINWDRFISPLAALFFNNLLSNV